MDDIGGEIVGAVVGVVCDNAVAIGELVANGVGYVADQVRSMVQTTVLVDSVVKPENVVDPPDGFR